MAGHDSMLLNLSGAHGPFFTRNIVVLTDNAGRTGVGEVPGGEKIRTRWRTRARWSWAAASATYNDILTPCAALSPTAMPADGGCRPSICASPSTR